MASYIEEKPCGPLPSVKDEKTEDKGEADNSPAVDHEKKEEADDSPAVKDEKKEDNGEVDNSPAVEHENKKEEADDSMTEMETRHKQETEEANSALKQKEDEVKSLRQSMTEMETRHKQETEEANSALKQREDEVKSLRQRLDAGMTFSCRRCETNQHEHKKSMTEMETFYKQKVEKANSTLKQKEDEVKSLRQKLAADVSVSIKAAGTESMNNPVNKSRLTEMYDNLKLLQWPKVKDDLKRTEMKPGPAQALIQETFEDAAADMKRKKQQIEDMFGLSRSSSGATPQKVGEYRQLTVQNLQMAVYHSSKEDLLKTRLHQHGNQLSEDVMVKMRPLTSECYWLGCLMALSNPPLLPDWKHHRPGMDPWDIFPADVKPAAEV